MSNADDNDFFVMWFIEDEIGIWGCDDSPHRLKARQLTGIRMSEQQVDDSFDAGLHPLSSLWRMFRNVCEHTL